ncbi:MAG: VWA domain containing CoxE-like protein [Promethearchaeota archaeon]|nr:MAG: VWA domain containing CoxE-like protein [Candidatus Lokiarchaeota archaeon]
MGVFPENPCEFAVEFISRMRKHPDIVQIPSSRQVLSIPRLILSRYYRNGSITPNDYIEISKVTSFPDNQELAKDIAFEILFPNYKKDVVSEFFGQKEFEKEAEEDFLSVDEKTKLDEIQDLIDEIEISVDDTKIEEMEQFLEELNKNRDHEPYKSALEFFNDESDLFKEEISSIEKLIEEAKKRFMNKINSLEPNDLKAGSNLDLNDLVEENSKRIWEKLANKALKNQDISEDIEELMKNGKFEDIIQSMKFLKNTDSLPQDHFQKMRENLQNQIQNLEQLFNAAKNLGETPSFDKEQVLNNSIKNSSFEHNFNLANTLDQYYGTNLRKDLLNRFNQMKEQAQMNLSLENLTKNAMANRAWNDLFNKALDNAVKDILDQKLQVEGFKSLSHQLQQLQNSCQNNHCSQKISQKLPDILKKTLEATKTPSELKNTVEFLHKIGLKPDSEEIKKRGKALGMPDEEIFELIEPNYQLLKKLIEKNEGNFERFQNLIDRLEDQLNTDRLKELLNTGLSADNRDALGALGHFDLEQALRNAQEMAGEAGVNKMVSCLSAGSGENLLKQWFIHRKNLPIEAKEKVKELAKKMLIELGIYYSRARLGTATTGPIPINVVRPYMIGDDIDNIDLEETINNILEKGKKLSHINYDDFYVYETAKGLRSACIELDISGSMSGEKLAYMAICTTMLVYSLKKDELAICFFESDTHIIKEMDKKGELEEIAEELLTISAKGGTRLQKALEWARRQFKEKSESREKLNILFTDAEVYDIEAVMNELRIFRSMGIDFILVCPEESFNLDEAKKMVKIAGGQLLTITRWEEFPDLISEILRSRF